jgi:sugar phosphate isomerase/epimerase
MSEAALKWAAQVITFYRPSFWGFETDEEVIDYSLSHPRDFYDRLMTEVSATGVGYVELCMAPGDWRTAIAAYGDGAAARTAIRSRGLELSGSYQSGWGLEQGLRDASRRQAIFDEVERHADFLHEAGVDLMLTGPTRRGTLEGSIFPRVSDASIEDTAEIISEMASIVRTRGVDLAIHTEAYSVVCRVEDIDRIMAVTEPGLVYLCPDSGHIALDGGNPAQVLRDHLPRIRSMHWKDCIGPRTELPASGVVTHELMMEQFRRMGNGIVDWDGVIAAFDAAAFDGYAVAEIDLSEDPGAEVRDILDYYARHRHRHRHRGAE